VAELVLRKRRWLDLVKGVREGSLAGSWMRWNSCWVKARREVMVSKK
jgi:hypothetical protein